MRKRLVFAATVIAALVNFTAHALDGDWRGELTLGPTKLPVVFHFEEGDGTGTRCTVDSPVQGVKGIPAEVTFCDADSVAVEIKTIGASFSGRISGAEVSGKFTQLGHSFPLTLSPEKPIGERRPQTPTAPFPYTSEETTFASADGTLLAGTLTIPDGASETPPVVVMVTGSGPQNRDEELFDHRPFAVIADFLARNGIASLRYDDRGVAKSSGSFKEAVITDFKEDARGAVKELRRRGGFGKVGIIGHSEGGTIALMLAADGDVDFAVSIAGAMARGKDIILAQNLRTLDKLQLTQKQKEDAASLISKVFDDLIAGKDYAAINVDEYIKAGSLDVPPVVSASMRQNLMASSGDYFRQLLSLDPSGWLGDIKVPVLGLNGTLDTQVESATNLEVLRKHVPHSVIKEYAGLNHLMQHAVTGELIEYDKIEETISPEVLNDMAGFIKSLK